MDDEKQKDEIVALESICNEEEFSHREIAGRRECTLQIFIRIPKDYHLNYKDARAKGEDLKKVAVSHLPPLTLYVSLPTDYPSKSSPNLTLCSTWLRFRMLSKLCKKLDRLWEENVGQEILFTWMAFLQDETLEFLDIKDSIDISRAYTMHLMALEKAQATTTVKDAQESRLAEKVDKEICRNKKSLDRAATRERTTHGGPRRKQRANRRPLDQRVVVEGSIRSNPVQVLVDYNENRNCIEFNRSFHMCKICFNEKSGEHSTVFAPCGHVFCKECITGYLEIRIKEGSVQNISCPEDKCTSEAFPGQIKDLVSPELFAKYDRILLNVTLETMTDIVYCPRRHCQYPVSREPNELMANCPACQYAFCIYCKMVYHGIEACKVTSGEKSKIVTEYQDASQENKLKLEQRYGKKQLQTLVENAMSENWITSNSHHCPHCNAAIEKSDGCNKMTCGRCNTFFCWICGDRLSTELPYLHYRNPQSKCFNKLYHGLIPDEDEDDYLNLDWEEEEEDEEDDFVDDEYGPWLNIREGI